MRRASPHRLSRLVVAVPFALVSRSRKIIMQLSHTSCISASSARVLSQSESHLSPVLTSVHESTTHLRQKGCTMYRSISITSSFDFVIIATAVQGRTKL